MRALRRTRIGEFSISDSQSVEDSDQMISLLQVAKKIYSEVELDRDQAQSIIHGKRIVLESDQTLAASFNGKLLAILEPVGTSYRSVTVFAEAFDG